MAAAIILHIKEDFANPGAVALELKSYGRDATFHEKKTIAVLMPVIGEAISDNGRIRCDKTMIATKNGEFAEKYPWESLEAAIARTSKEGGAR